MKLAICIVHSRDKNRVTDCFVQAGFKFTILHSTGGFLQEANVTIAVGVEDTQLEQVREILKAASCAREQVVTMPSYEGGSAGAILGAPINVTVGGAVMFIVPVESFERF